MPLPYKALTSFWIALLLAAFAVMAYTLLVKRLAEWVQPTRLRMADLGRDMLQTNLPDGEHRAIQGMLDDAFSARPAVVMALLLPFILGYYITRRVLRLPVVSGPPLTREWSKLMDMFVISALAANPFFALIIFIEVLTIGTLGLLIGGGSLIVLAFSASVKAELKSPMPHRTRSVAG